MIRKFPSASDLSRIRISWRSSDCASGPFVIPPILCSFEEVGDLVFFPNENCVHVCQTQGKPISFYETGRFQNSSWVVFPKPAKTPKMWAQTHENGTRRSSGSRGVLQMDSVWAVILFYVPGQDTLVSQGLSSPRSLNGNSNLPGKADEIYGGGGIDCDGPASHAEGGGGGWPGLLQIICYYGNWNKPWHWEWVASKETYTYLYHFKDSTWVRRFFPSRRSLS